MNRKNNKNNLNRINQNRSNPVPQHEDYANEYDICLPPFENSPECTNEYYPCKYYQPDMLPGCFNIYGTEVEPECTPFKADPGECLRPGFRCLNDQLGECVEEGPETEYGRAVLFDPLTSAQYGLSRIWLSGKEQLGLKTRPKDIWKASETSADFLAFIKMLRLPELKDFYKILDKAIVANRVDPDMVHNWMKKWHKINAAGQQFRSGNTTEEDLIKKINSFLRDPVLTKQFIVAHAQMVKKIGLNTVSLANMGGNKKKYRRKSKNNINKSHLNSKKKNTVQKNLEKYSSKKSRKIQFKKI